MNRKRLTFKKGIKTIITPNLASFELMKIADEEIEKFLEKYKINKTAEIGFYYKGGRYFEIKVIKY